MWLAILLGIILDVLQTVAGVYRIWWLLGVSVLLSFVVLAYIVIGIVAINSTIYVKRRTYDEVLAQDKKFGVPESVSVLPFERVTTKGSEGYDMVASFMRSRTGESHKYFIICHGYNSNRVTCNKYANVLLDLGYNTLCPDMRRCGETGGEGITFGVKESKDINLWIDYVYSIDKDAEISLYGISLGAASCDMVASERDDIHELVSYCSYASLKGIMVEGMVKKKIPHPLAVAVYPFIRDYIYARFGNRRANTNIVECMAKVKCPTIILHSNGDRFTNVHHAYDLKKANPNATFVEFEGSPHARSYGVYPEEYRSALVDFITATHNGEKMEDRYITNDASAESKTISDAENEITL